MFIIYEYVTNAKMAPLQFTPLFFITVIFEILFLWVLKLREAGWFGFGWILSPSKTVL